LQIRLNTDNEKLLGIYRELCRIAIPAYNEKESSIVNGMLTDKLRAEIDRMKRKKP